MWRSNLFIFPAVMQNTFNICYLKNIDLNQEQQYATYEAMSIEETPSS